MSVKFFLKFKDERGVEKRVEVRNSPFFIGRLPGCDLQINNTSLSRNHAKIERFGEIAVISDCGSSNGTTLNGNFLSEPASLQNGDEIELGGDVLMTFEIEGARNYATDYAAPNYETTSTNAATATTATNTTSSVSLLTNPFLLAPLGGFLVLGLVGGLLFAFAPRQKPKEDVQIVKKLDEESEKPTIKSKSDKEEEAKPTPTAAPDSSATPISSPTLTETPKPISEKPLPPVSPVSRELDKVETNAYKFLNKISFDTNAFLDSGKLRELSGQINKLKSSGAIRDNLRTAKKNFGQIQSAAQGNGLKPMLVAATALAKMGEKRSDVISDVNAVIPGLRNCADVLGTDGIPDALLVVAAFADGNNPKDLQGKIGSLTKESGVSSSDVRSVWFLKERGKISQDALNFVIRVIAIGAISQNPRDFGIDAEPLQ